MELTESQLEAASSIDQSVAVIAAAGSGKTSVLVERCLRAIQAGVPFEKLLIITFTEKAAGELKHRLSQHLPQALKTSLTDAWIGTFHAFCTRILSRHASLLHINPQFRILDEGAGRLLTHQAAQTTFLSLLETGNEHAALLVEALEFRNVIGLLEDLMAFRWHSQQLFSHGTLGSPEDQPLLTAVTHCFTKACDELQRYFHDAGQLDFQALETMTLHLFTSHPDILHMYQERFRHLFVDEYQDTNDLQTELVSLLHAPSRNHLFIVGDPRQSIYRFRGANVACFKKMLDRLEHLGGKIISLNENFRSRSSIINFVNEVAAPLGGDPLAAERPEVDPAVFALSIPSPEKTPYEELRREEAATIAAHLKGLFDRKAFVWKDMAILFQAMTTTDLYEQALRAFGIPFRTYGGKRFLDRPEIRDLLSALSFAADPSNTSSLLAILRSPLVGLSDDECVLLAGEKGKDFHKAALSSPRASFIQELLRVKEHLHPSELVRFILKETGYEVICQAIDPAGGKVANLEKFIGLACDLEREIQVTLPAFVEFIQNLIRRGARMGDAPVIDDLNSEVKIMTVHAAKGLEFPVVVLPDLIRQPSNATEPWCFVRGRGVSFKQRDPKFPFAPLVAPETFTELRKQDECEEEAESRRLLYVAMTRARDHLVLPIHPEHPTKGRWHRWITPHLEKVETITVNEVKGLTPERRLGGGASPELAEGLGEGFPLPRLSPKSGLVPSRSNTVTVSQLESFDRCPQEYYLKYQLLLPSGVLLAKHPERLSAPVKGSILHNALLMLAKNKTAHVHDLIAAECQALGISCDDATIHELAAPLQSFMKSPLFDDFHQGQHELRFDAIVEDRLITGKIDWLRQGKTGYEIVDFKTDRIDGGCEERAKNYELQMTTYALAIEMALGVSIERTILYFLHPQKTFEMAMSDGRRDEGRKKIAAILNRIAAKDFHLNSFTPPCVHPKTTCTYHINKLCWLDRQQ